MAGAAAAIRAGGDLRPRHAEPHPLALGFSNSIVVLILKHEFNRLWTTNHNVTLEIFAEAFGFWTPGH